MADPISRGGKAARLAMLVGLSLLLASCPSPVDVTSIPFRCNSGAHCVEGHLCHPELNICAPPGWPYLDAKSDTKPSDP